jgi:hypothetical protein
MRWSQGATTPEQPDVPAFRDSNRQSVRDGTAGQQQDKKASEEGSRDDSGTESGKAALNLQRIRDIESVVRNQADTCAVTRAILGGRKRFFSQGEKLSLHRMAVDEKGGRDVGGECY